MYSIEYIQIPSLSKDPLIKDSIPEYTPVDIYKVVGDTYYTTLSRPHV